LFAWRLQVYLFVRVRDTIEIQLFTSFTLSSDIHTLRIRESAALFDFDVAGTHVSGYSNTCTSSCKSANMSADIFCILDISSNYRKLASINFHRASPRREHASTTIIRYHNTFFTFPTTFHHQSRPFSPLQLLFLLQLLFITFSSFSDFPPCLLISTVKHHEPSSFLIESLSPQGIGCVVSAKSRSTSDKTSLSHLYITRSEDS
jgi:hypothetical protein